MRLVGGEQCDLAHDELVPSIEQPRPLKFPPQHHRARQRHCSSLRSPEDQVGELETPETIVVGRRAARRVDSGVPNSSTRHGSRDIAALSLSITALPENLGSRAIFNVPHEPWEPA